MATLFWSEIFSSLDCSLNSCFTAYEAIGYVLVEDKPGYNEYEAEIGGRHYGLSQYHWDEEKREEGGEVADLVD